MRHWPPSSIATDQPGSYPNAIGRLQREGKLSGSVKHRTCKYLNDIIEVMRMIRKGHFLTCEPHVKDEVRFINKLFDVYTAAA